MKKVLLPICATLLCMTACQKEENNGILTLEVEHYTSNAKVHLDDDNYAVWDNNDPVWVNGTDYEVSVSSTTAAISGVPTSTEGYKAIYPASWANNAGTTVTYPETQNYRTNGTEQVIDAPMAAFSDGGTLKFHNLGSILAVNVSGMSRVMKIEVIADGTTPINGTCTLNVTTGSPVLGAPTSGTTTTTLVCNGESVPSTGKTFYIALPPVSAKLTIKVDDGAFIYTRTQGSSMSFASNHDYNVSFVASDAAAEQYAPAPNQIWYTSSSTAITNFSSIGTLDSNVWNSTLDCYVATYSSEITSIPTSALSSRTTLLSISLPASVTSIGASAFNRCTKLTSVHMPNVATIGENAFGGCTKLTSVHISSALSSVGSLAFTNLNITDLYVHSSNPPSVQLSDFDINPNDATLHVPQGSTASTWTNWWGETSGIVYDL